MGIRWTCPNIEQRVIAAEKNHQKKKRACRNMRNSYFGTGGEKIDRKYISHTKGRGQNVNGEPRGMYINHVIVTMSTNGH